MKQDEEFIQRVNDWWEEQKQAEQEPDRADLLGVSGNPTDDELQEVIEGMAGV